MNGPERRWSGFEAGAVVALALFLGLPVLFFPLARDAGIFAYNAAALLDGQTPYVDFLDQKPPAILFLYAVPLLLFGRPMWGFHLFEWVWVAATALAAFRLGRRFGREETGYFAGITTAFLLSPAICDFWHRGQIETFIGLPYALILMLFLSDRYTASVPRQLAAGLLGGACFCLKPNMAGFPLLGGAVPLLLAMSGGRSARGPGSAPRTLAVFIVGFCIPPVVMLGWLWREEALGPFLVHMVAINATYIGGSLWETLGLFGVTDTPVLALFAVLLAALLVAPRIGSTELARSVGGCLGSPDETPRHFALLAALWLGGLATLLSGRFLFPYQHQVLILPCALTLAIAAAALGGPVLDRLRRRPLMRLAVWLLLPALCVGALERTLRPQDRQFYRGELTLEEYQGTPRFDFFDFSFRDDRALARRIDETTAPGDRVQIFGHGSLALLLADRWSASRFVYTIAAMDPRYGRDGKDREEILETLRASPPPLVVITRHDPLPRFDVRSSEKQVRAFPPLATFLDERYAPEEEVGDYLLLRRLSGGDGG